MADEGCPQKRRGFRLVRLCKWRHRLLYASEISATSSEGRRNRWEFAAYFQFGGSLMYIDLPNFRGGLDLALAMFSCIDLDDGDRLRNALVNVQMPLSGLPSLIVGFDEELPEPNLHKIRPNYILIGIDRRRFTNHPDLKALQDFLTSSVAKAIALMDVPESDKGPVLAIYNQWRTQLADPAACDRCGARAITCDCYYQDE